MLCSSLLRHPEIKKISPGPEVGEGRESVMCMGEGARRTKRGEDEAPTRAHAFGLRLFASPNV